MSDKITGGCLCGTVTYHIDEDPIMGIHCHCTDCQKSTGAGHASVTFFPRAAFHVNGDVKSYSSQADSGNTITRCFCPECGSSLYGYTENNPDGIGIMAGTLHDPNVFTPNVIVYDSRAPKWDVMNNDLPRFPEMPPKE
ncbi:MAG: aldehyde-activating protein [Kordiimonas sp.]|nr:aldehyde-activating protein [Kordiimonas sp.]|tara:strand:+ start:3518 stop:3934 length:417 start_codon:yes stop_codon:yes gene_type:complete